MFHNLDGLDHFEQQTLAEFLLYHLKMDTRRELMAQLPIIYGKVFPRVDSETVLERVSARLMERGR